MSLHSFNPDIAARVGLNAAVIYQNIVFWTEKNLANGKHVIDGHVWTYNSIKAWGDLFPYLSADQIRRALDRLVAEDLIVSGNHNQSAYDRTKWYGVSPQIHLGKTTNGFGKNPKPIPDSKPDIKTDSKLNPLPPSGEDLFSDSEPSPKTGHGSEPTPETGDGSPSLFSAIEPKVPSDTEPDRFDEFWKSYPNCQRKTDKPKARSAFWAIVQGKRKGIDKTPAETIIAAVRRYAATSPDPQYVPMPTTWLNGARWEQFPEVTEETRRRKFAPPAHEEVVR